MADLGGDFIKLIETIEAIVGGGIFSLVMLWIVFTFYPIPAEQYIYTPDVPLAQYEEYEMTHVESPYDGESELYFPLTEAERDLVERVVSAEARGEPYRGIKAVAQVIVDRVRSDSWEGEDVTAILTRRNQFAAPHQGYISENVRNAVAEVFDQGYRVTESPITAFYSTKGGFVSRWHESLVHVTTIGNHRFFRLAGEV